MKKRIFSLITALAVATTMLAAFCVNVSAASSGIFSQDFSGEYTPHSNTTLQTSLDGGTLKVEHTEQSKNVLLLGLHDLDGTKDIVFEFDIKFAATSPSAKATIHLTVGTQGVVIMASSQQFDRDDNWWRYRALLSSDGTSIVGISVTKTNLNTPGATPQPTGSSFIVQSAQAASVRFTSYSYGATFWLDNLECYSGLNISDMKFKLGGNAIDSVAAGTTGVLSADVTIKLSEAVARTAKGFVVAFDRNGMMIDCKDADVTLNPAGTNNGETIINIATTENINIDDIDKVEFYLWNTLDDLQPLVKPINWSKQQ